MNCAVGYAVNTGLVLMKKMYESIISINGGTCELVIGTLQNYPKAKSYRGINRDTANYLKMLMDDYAMVPIFEKGGCALWNTDYEGLVIRVTGPNVLKYVHKV